MTMVIKINGKRCCLWTVVKSSSIWCQIFYLCRGWWLNNSCRHKEQSPLWCWEMVRCWSCQEIPQYQTIQSWRLLQRIELLNSQFKDYKLHHWVLQFLCQPNVGDPESLKQGLKNIIPHAFGEHTCCNVSWCGFKQNPVAYKHTDLPNGKDLFGDSLKIALSDILDEYSTDIVVNKLTPRANSQRNESLNSTIGS